MNPILQALLDQFKNVKIDVDGLLKDPDLLPALMPVLRIVLNHVKPPERLMDIVAVITAITNLLTEIIKSQPPEVQADLWRIYLADLKEWRAFFGKPPLA